MESDTSLAASNSGSESSGLENFTTVSVGLDARCCSCLVAVHDAAVSLGSAKLTYM